MLFMQTVHYLKVTNLKENKMSNIITERVSLLREYMRENNLSAVVIPSSDPHGSEYVAEHWKSREWVSGFEGSMGTAVITLNEALLWTDSRYWLAAEKVLPRNGYKLMKDGAAETPSIVEWLQANINGGENVAIEGSVCPHLQAEEWKEKLSVKGITLTLSHDPIAAIWHNRPAMPMSKAEILPAESAGESVSDKIKRIRELLATSSSEGILITMLDEIAWITNLRGNDIEFNPVLVAYMLITAKNATLFIDKKKIDSATATYLAEAGIECAGYSTIWQQLKNYNGKNIILSQRCNALIVESLPRECRIVWNNTAIASMKAVKNSCEIEGFRKAMLSEGVAMTKLLYWLKNNIGKEEITEIDVDKKLTELRSEDENFCGLSFATIAAYGENGAIVHYEPTEQEHSTLKPESFLLLDCGGQYKYGTTDVTRTIALGALTKEQKEDYTRVLRGHISLAKAKFPAGTCGTQLDILARQWLWQAGENFLHGTGHGVGHYLNVHEGPHQIRMNYVPAPLVAGMTVTNEPGLYKAGRYGIRIENTMLVKDDITTEFGSFCSLTPLTICPIDKEPIIPEILGYDAIEYLDKYHEWVFEKLSPYFEGEIFEFLKHACAPINL